MSNRNVLVTSQVTTLVSAATTDRWQILIENYGSVSIWIGDDSDVSAGEDGTGSEVRPKGGREFNFETELKYDQFQNSPQRRLSRDFIRVCGGNPAFGTGTAAFKASNVEGKVDAYIPIYDFRLHFDDGLRLARGSGAKLVLNVLDQTDDIDSFNAMAYGKRVIR